MKEKLLKRMHFMNLYELRAIEEYLEEMAAKGLMFVKVRGLFFYFRKCEPKTVKFCVDVFGKTSFFRKEQGQTTRDYIDYCEAAGWRHLSARDKWHFFYTEDLSCVPIHTDSKMQLKMINHQVLRENGLAWLTYLYLFFMLIQMVVSEGTWVDRLIRFESSITLLCASIFFFLMDAIWYAIFYIRNLPHVRAGKELCFTKKRTVELAFGIRNGVTLFTIMSYILTMCMFLGSEGYIMAVIVLLLMGIVVFGDLFYQGKGDWGRRNNTIFACVIIGISIIGAYSLMTWASTDIFQMNDTSVMVYDEEEKCDIEYFISDDKIPYELSNIPEGTAHNSKEKQVEASAFGKYTSYEHCFYDEKMEVLGDLSYDVIRTPFDFILQDYVENEMKLDYLQVTDITEQESELWGAKKVYLRQNKEDKSYVGRIVQFEDCVLIISSNQLVYNSQEIKNLTNHIFSSTM